jgi:hypothetical protein
MESLLLPGVREHIVHRLFTLVHVISDGRSPSSSSTTTVNGTTKVWTTSRLIECLRWSTSVAFGNISVLVGSPELLSRRVSRYGDTTRNDGTLRDGFCEQCNSIGALKRRSARESWHR